MAPPNGGKSLALGAAGFRILSILFGLLASMLVSNIPTPVSDKVSAEGDGGRMTVMKRMG
jgi:hypothetical protein